MTDETLFAAALQLENQAAREDFLSRACKDHPVLRAQVDELLKAHEQSNALLDDPTGAAQFDLDTDDETIELKSQRTGLPSLPTFEPCDSPGRLGKLGAYEIIELVGQGGMGIVLRAWDTKLHREVALKIMSAELAAHTEAVERFLREARSAASVVHDHVVTIHAIDDTRQPPLLAMEFVEGETLQQRITREGGMPLAEIVRRGREMARGLAAAHAKGLIHRDVKPGNILLERSTGRAKITDFGLARAADNAELTHSGMILGTPQYMSPEQARGDVIDHRSDLFSLGSVLYAMCTGQPAFPSESTVGALNRVCNETPIPIRQLNAKIPKWLASIVNRLLRKDPNARFQTADELADALASKVPANKHPRRWRLNVALIVATTLLAAGTLAISGLVVSRSTLSPSSQETITEETTLPEDLPGEALVPSSATVDMRTPRPAYLSFPPRRRWTEPIRLRSVALYDREVALSADGLELVLASLKKPNQGVYDLYAASRQSITAPFGPTQNLGAGINGSFGERFPTLSLDGLQLIYWTTRPAGSPSPAGLMQSTRSSLSEPFKKAVPIEFEGDHQLWDIAGIAASETGLELILSSAGPDKIGRQNLWRLTRPSRDAPFGAPAKLSARINSTSSERGPCLVDGGRTLYFSSTRNKGPRSKGLESIWKCSRSSLDQPFSTPVRLDAPVNIEGSKSYSLSISADENVLVFRSHRDGRKATLPPPPYWQSERLPPTAADILASEDWVWTVPKLLGPDVNTPNANLYHPALSDDGCKLIYSLNSITFYITERQSVDKPFGKPRKLSNAIFGGKPRSASAFEFSPGGLRAVFSSASDSSAEEGWLGSLYSSNRPSISDPFGPAKRITFESDLTEWSFSGPYLTADGLTLYFDSSGSSENSRFSDKIWVATRRSLDAPFSTPRLLAGSFNQGRKAKSPFVTSDGCAMVYGFAKNRPEKLKICLSTRPSPEQPFGEPQQLPAPINIARFNSRSPTLSADGKVLIFSSNRTGVDKLWESHRVPREEASRSLSE